MRRLIAGTLALLAFAAPAQAAHHTNRYRIHRLEQRFTQLVNREAQEAQEISALENENAGLKNTLMCLHAAPIKQLVWGVALEQPFQLDEQPEAHDWAVLADDYCLTDQNPTSTHRLMVPIEPPTFYPENH